VRANLLFHLRDIDRCVLNQRHRRPGRTRERVAGGWKSRKIKSLTKSILSANGGSLNDVHRRLDSRYSIQLHVVHL